MSDVLTCVQCVWGELNFRTQQQTSPSFPPAEHIAFVETQSCQEMWKELEDSGLEDVIS